MFNILLLTSMVLLILKVVFGNDISWCFVLLPIGIILFKVFVVFFIIHKLVDVNKEYRD